MTTQPTRPKRRPSRRTRHSKDDSDIYAALNDFTDAIEAMPSELVRQFTLLREVDAKYSDLQSKISTEIDTFITSASKTPPQQRGQQLFSITRLMTSALGCADEKVSVASSAADISDKHKLRLDADYDRLETSEISELIQFGPSDHPAYLAGMTMGMSRSASRRLAIAEAKKRDEDLQDWRKEQIGRRGQLVAEERTKTGAGAKKKAAALSAVGGRENGVGTPPRGVTPVGVVGEVVKKSHHKKKPPRTDEEPAVSHKRKHPNQYVPTPNRQNTPREQMREVEDEGIGDTSNDGVPGDEHTYCYCNGVSYGEMVACDRENCAREWFHLECAELAAPPKGKWYCKDCKKIMEREKRGGHHKKARTDGGKTAR